MFNGSRKQLLVFSGFRNTNIFWTFFIPLFVKRGFKTPILLKSVNRGLVKVGKCSSEFAPCSVLSICAECTMKPQKWMCLIFKSETFWSIQKCCCHERLGIASKGSSSTLVGCLRRWKFIKNVFSRSSRTHPFSNLASSNLQISYLFKCHHFG